MIEVGVAGEKVSMRVDFNVFGSADAGSGGRDEEAGIEWGGWR